MARTKKGSSSERLNAKLKQHLQEIGSIKEEPTKQTDQYVRISYSDIQKYFKAG